MKHPLFSLILLPILSLFAARTQAQSQAQPEGHIAVFQKFGEQKIDTFRVFLKNDLISLKYKQQQLDVSTLQGLDSFMKKIPDLSHLEIYFESQNASSDKIVRTYNALYKCNCHVTAGDIKMEN